MFSEAHTIEQLIKDTCQSMPPKWECARRPQLPRQPAEVFSESNLRHALVTLYPEVSFQSYRAYELNCKLKAISLTDQKDKLDRSNEASTQWMGINKSYPCFSLLTSRMGENQKLDEFLLTFICPICGQTFPRASGESAASTVSSGRLVA